MLALPLPWDHLDTGIDKRWLQEDLERALAAATVPDCSFAGCSHCGVCGIDFGHNVVVAPPPIPRFQGHPTPNQQRVQRLRVWFGKQGEMALLSHLDLLRLFDRAIRRAALPISFTGGYHPSPRISPANALSLGITSSGEIVDFELSQILDETEFQTRLLAQLPPELPIYRVETVDLNGASATQLLEQAEYQLSFAAFEPEISGNQIQAWVDQILACDRLEFEQTTKSGQQRQVNLRDRLFELELLQLNPDLRLRYIGSCRNDGNLLRPEHLVWMLEQVSGQTWHLQQIHRQRLMLAAPPADA